MVATGTLTATFTASSTGRRTVARCYHGQCGRTFGGEKGFDLHLRLLDVPPWVVCLDPAEVGLTEVDGVWVRRAPALSLSGTAKSS